MNFESLAREHVRALSPYTPGFQPQGDGWIKINTNESPYPAQPGGGRGDHRHRSAGCDSIRIRPPGALRQAVARHCGVGDDEVIIGNGSDDVLNLLVRVFGGPGRRTRLHHPGLFPLSGPDRDGGGEGMAVEFDRSMELPVRVDRRIRDAAFLPDLAQCADRCRLSQRPDPGNSFRPIRGILVVDEAYADFADENAACLLADHPNLVITRTLSKSHGLAGLRIGYALARPR